MDAWSSSQSPDGLLADLEWLNRLAYRLVSDPGLADDACQEAWLAALRQGSGARPDRSSLTRLLRSTLGSARRSERRRRHHETQAARRDRLPSTEELLLVGERQQELWRHLSELPEPYRSALLLRYQQGISTSDLAKRSGEAADTIRWRLRRGLELLKESLECDEDGPRLMGLVPLALLGAGPSKAATLTGISSSATASLGAFWMMKKLALAVGLALLAVLGWKLLGDSPLEPSLPETSPGVAATDVARLTQMPEPTVQQRSTALAPTAAAEVVEPTLDPSWSLIVTVLESDGRPVAGAGVLMTVGKVVDPLGVTDAQGRLEGALPSLDARGLALWDSAYRPGLLVSKFGHASKQVDLPLDDFEAPGSVAMSVTLTTEPCLTGRVQGPNGQPLQGAGCTLWRFGEGDFPTQLRSTLSDADGAFAFPVQPEPDARGFVLIDDDLGRACTPTMDIGVATDLGTLQLDALNLLHGRVAYPDGQPVEGVHVRFSPPELLPTTGLSDDGSFLSGHTWGSTSTDGRGRFEFQGVWPGAYVVSVTSDPEPGVSEFDVQVPAASELFLTVPHPRLRLFVHDVNGVPAAGVRVHMKSIEGSSDDGESWYRATNESGVFSADVTNGRRYAYLVLGRHGTTGEQTIRIPATGYQHEAHVTIGDARRDGSVRVRLLTPDGSPLEAFEVLLRTTPSRLDLEEEERSPGPDGLLTDVPEGRFLMVLTPDLDPGDDRYLHLDDDEQVVDVRADEVNEVTFQMLRGGHVEVTLDVGRWPQDAPSLSERPDLDTTAGANWLQSYGVRIELVAASTRRLFAFNERNPWASKPTWVPGLTARNHDVLVPGRYAYRVTGPAWEPIEGTIQVRAGEAARLHLTLEPR